MCESVQKKLIDIEKSIFYEKTVLFDVANSILKYGVESYFSLIKQIKVHKPKQIIGKIDASTKYRIRDKFGTQAYKKVNQLIRNGEIECSPSRSECDVYLIQANIMDPNSIILSNDSFKDFNLAWTKSLRIVKYLRIDSRFYFNLDLKGVVEEMEELSDLNLITDESGIERLWDGPKSIGEIDFYPEEGVN